MKQTAIVIGAFLLVAACSSPSGPSISAIPVYRSTPSVTPASSSEIAIAGAAFKPALAAYNKALQTALRARGKGDTVALQRDYYAALAAAEAKFLKAIDAIPWPAALADKVRTLREASTVLRSRELRAAKARSLRSLSSIAITVQSADNRAADAAAILREALGLPPA